MFARIRPASKMGQRTVGPIDQNRLAPRARSPKLTLSNPNVPVRENRGNRSTVTTPTRAVAAANAQIELVPPEQFRPPHMVSFFRALGGG